MSKQRYAQRVWAELKTAGDRAPTMDFIESVLAQKEDEMISREELTKRITAYFRSITAVVVDDDGEEHTIWTQAPTKTAFALAIGVSPYKLPDYINGHYAPGRKFNENRQHSKRIVASEDFDLLRKSYAIIQSFYEGKLSAGNNCTGSIFWLLNANSGWTNEHSLKVEAIEEPKPALTLEELPTYQLEQQHKNIAIPDFEEDDD